MAEIIHREHPQRKEKRAEVATVLMAPGSNSFVMVNILLPVTTAQEHTPALVYSPSQQRDGDKRGDEGNSNRGASSLLYGEYFECRILQCYCKTHELIPNPFSISISLLDRKSVV